MHLRTFGALALVLCTTACATADDTEWRYYAKDAAATRHAALDQIHTGNVAQLERAWTYRTGDIAEGRAHYAECTPLVIDGILYVITPFSRLIAIDSVTGAELWRFSPDPPLGEKETQGGGLASRGLAYSEIGDKRRIFLPVRDGRIYAIDVDTRRPDSDFGDNGYINLRTGLPREGQFLFLSSPPALYKHVLLQPYGISDGSKYRQPYVPLRAYDARTGEALWTFHTIPRPGQVGHETWAGDSWKNRGGCNPWAPISVDTERGLFYVPLGAPNNDKYGGDRHGDNLFSNSVVALDALTGERRWHFQTVYHDLWDYDLPAVPTLVDLTVDGRHVPAVAVIGKTGFAYILNREDGTPVFPIEERPVPASRIPGELASPTQPFPTKPPAFARQGMTVEDLHGTDPEARAALLKRYKTIRSEGLFTPPSKEWSVVLPGQLGGGNWSGAAATPSGMLYVTANELPYVSTVEKDDGPFGVRPRASHFRDANGYPAIKPPWGTLTKLDLNRGELVWQIPLGNFDELNDGEGTPTGQMNFGGATVTGGGVVFAAASMDGKFHAFSAETGEVLYEAQLEAAGYGAPVTYLGRDGKQYVAIFAGGGSKPGSPSGDYVVAFRLP
jgi:quinoprotein glucose dehydrogenase